ncbi:MAG: hypothetical protein DBP03_04495 [gamma proteobacterium symbiont of Ctena orbiculata]|nr:MAG: hypothetical protein DBP03_04495 [gamma proteobacterium symbiont of Ctena orbiculata]
MAADSLLSYFVKASAPMARWYRLRKNRQSINTFQFKLAKRNQPLLTLPHNAADDGEDKREWIVVLEPTLAYQIEIALISLIFPLLVVCWLLLNSIDTIEKHGVDESQFWATIIVSSLLPLVVAKLIFFASNKNEVLSSVWNAMPTAKLDQLSLVFELPIRKRPYSWRRNTGDEVLLRYAMDEYFHVKGIKAPNMDVRSAFRLFAWFTAPAYLSLASLFLLAISLSIALKDPSNLRPSSFGSFSTICSFWALSFYLYAEIQTQRIINQLEMHPAPGNTFLPGLFQAESSVAPNVRSKFVRAFVPGILAFILGLSILIFQSLLT